MFEKEIEERFIKSYSEFCCNEKPLSPFWDLWQAGAEYGYNKANEYAKTIIQDLLDNSDEYARERAINFLREQNVSDI